MLRAYTDTIAASLWSVYTDKELDAALSFYSKGPEGNEQCQRLITAIQEEKQRREHGNNPPTTDPGERQHLKGA